MLAGATAPPMFVTVPESDVAWPVLAVVGEMLPAVRSGSVGVAVTVTVAEAVADCAGLEDEPEHS